MKKSLSIVLVIAFLLGLAVADKTAAELVKVGAYEVYLDMGSETAVADNSINPKKFNVTGVTELGVKYGLNKDWTLAGSTQFLSVLNASGYEDDKVALTGPLTITGEKNLNKAIMGLDSLLEISYTLLPSKVSYDLDGSDDPEIQTTTIYLGAKVSKALDKKLTVGGSFGYQMTSVSKDDEDLIDSKYEKANSFVIGLGADYVIDNALTAYVKIAKKLDSDLVAKYSEMKNDQSGSLLIGAQYKL
jgi:hypothetical protein